MNKPICDTCKHHVFKLYENGDERHGCIHEGNIGADKIDYVSGYPKAFLFSDWEHANCYNFNNQGQCQHWEDDE